MLSPVECIISCARTHTLQGYLAHEQTPPPLGPPQGPRRSPTEDFEEGVISYEKYHCKLDTLKQARRGKALQAIETFFFAGLDDPDKIVRVLYICIYTCIYVYIYMYIYTYMYVYIHT
jgi:hypothetical protein